MHGEHEEKPVARPARATVALEPEERARLGLPDTPSAVGPLPPLDEEQRADPAAVAAGLALVHSNYRATKDPVVVRARSAAVRRLQEDLASSSGGEADLAELRATDCALVDLTIQRFFVNDGALDPERIVFRRVTLVRDRLTGHWQVADLQLS